MQNTENIELVMFRIGKIEEAIKDIHSEMKTKSSAKDVERIESVLKQKLDKDDREPYRKGMLGIVTTIITIVVTALVYLVINKP